jgi:hypothetical protein
VRASEAEEVSWDRPDALPSTTTRYWARLARRVVLALLVVVLLVLAVQSAIAYSALEDARGAQKSLADDIARRDLAAAQDHARLLAADTGRARLGVWGPWWALPEAVPWYGDDVRAGRLTVQALDDVASKVAVPLVETSAHIQDGLRKADGSVDVAVLDRLTSQLATASKHADDASERLATINVAGLASPLRGTVLQTRGDIDQLAKTVHGIRDGLVLAQTLVGAQQPHVTLLGVQNPAESRGTGGIIGVWALLSASDGKVRLRSTGVNDQLTTFIAPRSDVPADVVATYGAEVRDVRNVNMSPDFPVAARLLADTYRRYAIAKGAAALPPDASVLTVTPRALAGMLAVTGPVTVTGYGTRITSDNAAEMFTNGVYSAFPSVRQRSEFVQQVLTQVFTRLQQPRTDPMLLVDQLRRLAGQRDLLAWSPDRRIQAAITRLGISGALSVPDGRSAWVTLVNADASKLDYYVRAAISLRHASGGRGALEVTLRNTAPRALPSYVRSHDGRTNRPPTSHDLIIQLHLPPTVGVAAVSVDGQPVGFAAGQESGWTVVRRMVRLRSDGSTTLTVSIDGDVGTLRDVVPPVMTTPVAVDVR